MQKIIIVDNSFYVTGAIKSIIAAINLLKDRYHFEFVMDIRGDAAKYVIESGWQVENVNFWEISRSWRIVIYPFVLFVNSLLLARIAQKRGAQIIHINDLYNLAGLLAKVFNWKLAVIYHIRLIPESYVKPIYNILAWLIRRWADAIIYVSRAAGEKFWDAPQATHIYDSLTGPPIHPPKKIRNELNHCRFLYVGNYVRGKGQNFALEAFAKIAHLLSGATLRFVGNGVFGELDKQYIDKLKRHTSNKDLEDRVYFEGPIGDVEQTMKDADVVVNLSESESFSMVCLEALTYGLPLVASDCGGPRELVENEVNGLLVENRNIEQAADAMFRLATEPGLAARLGGQGPISVREKFSVEKSARQIFDVYEGLIAR